MHSICKNQATSQYYLTIVIQVECNDEGEANKAFKEAMALQELRHPYICGYKEFFVTWDKEVRKLLIINYIYSSICVTIKSKFFDHYCWISLHY